MFLNKEIQISFPIESYKISSVFVHSNSIVHCNSMHNIMYLNVEEVLMFYYPTFAYISIVRIGVWGIHQVVTNLPVIVMHEPV